MPSRWSIEAAIEDAKQIFGTGQARNRTAGAVERTVPFQLACQAIAITWYTTAGHDPADADDRKARAPWYASKSQPSTADMTAKLRRVIIAARFHAARPDHPTREEISALRLAQGFAKVEFVESELQAGSFVITGGLASHSDGVRVELSPDGMLRDEPRLPVHGFAVVEAPSLEQAAEVASRMLRLHQSHVPDWAGNCEVRPVVTHCLP